MIVALIKLIQDKQLDAHGRHIGPMKFTPAIE